MKQAKSGTFIFDLHTAAETDQLSRTFSGPPQSPLNYSVIGLTLAAEGVTNTIIAHAAAKLGFNTSPPEAVGLAQNKFATRQLDNNVFCRMVRSPDELERMLSEDGPHIHYPLIVKPSSSEGVWEVANEQELREKVPLLWRDAFTSWHGHDVVIETYVDGPEVDANMVLIDGKIVFVEVNDDFPGERLGR
ncbi:hypothetical protein MGYG_08425 [Nannizzia gypsea CBS 118893]|uniref:Uncharacterized protein n=1 Tax=Arthroderma gypseum (strain ATCC MYA-4604 / CBS 118893) TaxID=535722 RepID=E4V5N8_ARTGP|nr:hypothetical protein MGYG_08425 [Nannizzia gypsea CBS 118893]EFR05413.1 hypothetical protein MGYG_08425 [Nannizzia gypsea CBS 118893]